MGCIVLPIEKLKKKKIFQKEKEKEKERGYDLEIA
jgi:hypothetical protein